VLWQMPPPKPLPQSESATRSLLDINGFILKFLNNYVSNCCWCHLLSHIVTTVITVYSIVLVFVQPVSVPGFDLSRQQWSLLNRFRTEQGHCGACRRKWRLTDTDLCPCGETQTMSHIVKSCPLTKVNGGLSRLHSADEDAVSWLTNYG